MSLTWLSSILLFLLLFLNTLEVDPRALTRLTRAQWRESAFSLALIFLFFPLLTAAAARLFLRDQDLAFGMVITALAPCALVNPFFAKHRDGEADVALLNVFLSTLLCPLVTVPILHVLGMQSVFLDTRYMIYFLLTLTAGPLLLSLAVVGARGPIVSLTGSLPWINSLILASLVFILVGSSLERVPMRNLWDRDFFVLAVMFLIFDFGFYGLTRWAGALFVSPVSAETMAISVATRNFAVSASLMLFFHPKAAVPSAVGLLIHILFFQWLLASTKR